MTIRTAVIGLGIMGRRMAENMVLHPDFTVTTMWDPDPAACAAAQKVAPDATASATASEAMADVDLVYLACPPVPRKAYALEAAAAGKAIFLEKPLGVDIAESRALVAELQAAGVPAAVNFTQAAGAALTDLTRSIGEGALGDLCGIDIIVTYPAWPRAWQVDADWLRFAAEGAKLVIGDKSAAVHETAQLVKDAGGEAVALEIDAGVEADVAKLVATAKDTYGALDVAFAREEDQRQPSAGRCLVRGAGLLEEA